MQVANGYAKIVIFDQSHTLSQKLYKKGRGHSYYRMRMGPHMQSTE